ncbi:MAG: autoinducer binding domain-containing protein, partial [Acidobacteria bacterium]|nr:autoinducer binding domain-containing protein [Acidobacteriota bacterium]
MMRFSRAPKKRSGPDARAAARRPLRPGRQQALFHIAVIADPDYCAGVAARVSAMLAITRSWRALMRMWLGHSYYDPGDSGLLLRGRLEGLVSDLGLDHFAYAMARPPRDCGAPGERAALSSLPQPLIERFLESGWLSLSLVLDRATRSNHPFFWGGERFRRAIARPQRRLYDEVRGFGLSHGLGIPVHCARGATGGFIVTAGSAGRVVRAVRGTRGRLYGAA